MESDSDSNVGTPHGGGTQASVGFAHSLAQEESQYAPSQHDLGSQGWQMDQVVALCRHQHTVSAQLRSATAFSNDWANRIESESRQQRRVLKAYDLQMIKCNTAVDSHTQLLATADTVVATHHAEQSNAVSTLQQQFRGLETRFTDLSPFLDSRINAATQQSQERMAVLEAQLNGMQQALQQQSDLVSDYRHENLELRAQLEHSKVAYATLSTDHANLQHTIQHIETRLNAVVPTPGVPAVVNIAGVHAGAALRTPQPQNFNPSKKEVGASDWLVHTEAVFQAAKVPPADWVTTAIPYLLGVAAAWATDRVVYTTLTSSNWDYFSKQLMAQFELGDKSQRAKDTLKTLSFKRGNDLVLFISKLRRAFTDIGGLSEENKLDYFEQCVEADLTTLVREAVLADSEFTFDQLCEKLMLHYSIYKRSNTQFSQFYSLLPPKASGEKSGQPAPQKRGGRFHPRSRSGPDKPSGSTTPMPVSASAPRVAAASAPSGSSSAVKSSGPPRKHCTYCKKPGHTQDVCYIRRDKEAAAKSHTPRKAGK